MDCRKSKHSFDTFSNSLPHLTTAWKHLLRDFCQLISLDRYYDSLVAGSVLANVVVRVASACI